MMQTRSKYLCSIVAAACAAALLMLMPPARVPAEEPDGDPPVTTSV